MEIDHLSFKHHRDAPYFFKDLSFTLERGRIHALHGKNGIGKSVLLHLLSGKVPPDGIMKGKIEGVKNGVLLNQRFDQMIADQFTFLENLQFAGLNRFPHPFLGLQGPTFYPDFLKPFHIDVSQPVGYLSGGQRQILTLLMVMQKKKNVFLLDEPTATLDEQNACLVFEFLKTLTAQNITVLVVCHDRDLIHRYADGHHLVLERGSDGLRTLKIL